MIKQYSRWLWLVILGNFLITLPNHAATTTTPPKLKPLEITRITPEGNDVPAARQIVIQFNQPVVPVGKMERDAAEIPITITPTLSCEWRWLNTSALACELTETNALKPATRYEMMVQPGIKTEAGQTLVKPYSHKFITHRPAVSETDFQTWRAPGMPKIRVQFNQPVKQDSVEKSLYFRKENGQRVVVVAEKPEPTKEGESNYYDTSIYSDAELETQPDISKSWIVAPKELLPMNMAIELKVAGGLVSPLGHETGVENRSVVSFHTFPEFEFLGVTCTNLEGNEVKVPSINKGIQEQRCDPMRQVALRFSSPITLETLRDNLVMTPDLAGGRKDYNPWEGRSGYSRLNESHEKEREYEIWLPELLKAYETYQLKIPNNQIFKDEFNRPLTNTINMRFATDHRSPNYVFEHASSVLEKGVDSEVPFYTTNLKSLSFKYHLLNDQGWQAEQQKTLKLPTVEDVAVKIPFGIRELLGNQSGVVQGHFAVEPDTGDDEANRWFFAQITPFQVHSKLGYHNTTVWVTDLATGKPVQDATLTIYKGTFSESPSASLATATTDANGLATLPGTETLDPELSIVENNYQHDKPRFFIQCRKNQDMGLLPLESNFQVYLYDGDIYPYNRKKYEHIHTWGTTAQGVYKVGDTVQFKIFVRDQGNQFFNLPPLEGYQLTVKDPTGKVAHEIKELKLNEFGTFAGEFTLPKTAAVGWYDFELNANFRYKDSSTWQPMRVLVSDFTPAPFRVNTALHGNVFSVNHEVKFSTTATLHAGGPYSNATTRMYAIVEQEVLTSSDPKLKDFVFDTMTEEHYDRVVHEKDNYRIDNKGELHASFTLPEKSPVLYGSLRLESAVQDERGKNVASSVSAKYIGRDRFVGLKETTWLLEAGKEAKIEAVVVDEYGNSLTISDNSGNLAELQFKIEREEIKASRVKGAGNAYLTQYNREWIDAGQCREAVEGKFFAKTFPATCSFVPEKAGDYRITATVTDTKGRTQSTQLAQWATGQEWVTWESEPGHSLQVIPAQETYKVGETAKYLVKNPFPGAQALITVERFGVIKSWVKTLPTSMEVIEIPVEADFVPGYFVSVVVMSPRVDKPIDDNQVDLGKPAFRMGYTKTVVNDPYKQLVVDIHPDKAEYRPREQVTINFQAKPLHPPLPTVQQDGKEVPQPIELTVVVLDEGVFDLIRGGKDYFDPYKGFYTLDKLDVNNFSLMLNLVGRQKFEKKGATPGGDGGMGLGMRSVFKYVSYWNPSLKTDAEGKAQIQFTAPDNLTGWRVLVMATTPTDRMGLSDANFKVNQPLELRPVLPNQVLESDSFYAGFSVMNRTDKPHEVAISAQAKGNIEAIPCPAELKQCGAQQTLQTEPYKRYVVWLPIKAKTAGKVEFSVQAKSGELQDGLTQTLEIRPRRADVTAATYGTFDNDKALELLQIPPDIYPDVGGVQVVVSPTVIGGVDGAFEYMRDYPYFCWEQKLSKATMASHFTQLQDYVSKSVTWEGAADLPANTLKLATEYQAPNGGMAFYQPKDEYVNPYLSAYTALAFNWLRNSKYEVPAPVENKLHDYLFEMLRKNVMPKFYSKGMASSVRAVALAALAKHGKVAFKDIKRYELDIPQMDLFGKAHFLLASLQVPEAKAISSSLLKKILSQANETSGKISFNETLDDGYKQLLTSVLRSQCVVLSSLVAYQATVNDGVVGDLPWKLVRQITQTRKQKGRWENTQENMFCMNALREYANVYEKATPDMIVTAWLDEQQLSPRPPLDSGDKSIFFKDVQDESKTFAHDMTAADVGRKATVKVERSGTGRVYYALRLNYAEKTEKATAINSGIEVKREYHIQRDKKWEVLTSPMTLKTGDLVRVDLYVNVPATRHFVVVDDPVPGGLEPVNRDLATSSEADASKAESDYAGGSLWFSRKDWVEFAVNYWSFYHKELRHHAALFYSDYLPPGNYHLSYVAQAVAPGEFTVMPTHAEEMYEPEVFGKSMPAILKVERAE